MEVPTSEPKTLPEWRDYILVLSGADLRSKAIAANSVAFVRALEADGLSARDIADVFRAFAQRLLQDEQVLPSRTTGDYLDYGMVAYPVDLAVASVE